MKNIKVKGAQITYTVYIKNNNLPISFFCSMFYGGLGYVVEYYYVSCDWFEEEEFIHICIDDQEYISGRNLGIKVLCWDLLFGEIL